MCSRGLGSSCFTIDIQYVTIKIISNELVESFDINIYIKFSEHDTLLESPSIRYGKSQNICLQIVLKSLGARKQKVLNRISQG